MTLKIPGVEVKIVDNSDYIAEGASTAFGMCVKSNQGTLDLKAISSAQQFKKIYGDSDINFSESHFQALQLLSTNNNILYCKRVIGNAKPAGCILYHIGEEPKIIELPDKYLEVNTDYEELNTNIKVCVLQLIKNHMELQTGDQISVIITCSDSQYIIQQPFELSSNNTLKLFAERIKNRLEILSPNYSPVVSVPNADSFIYNKEKITLTIKEIISAFKGTEIYITTSENYPDIDVKSEEKYEYDDLEEYLKYINDQINTNYSSFVTSEVNEDLNTITITTIKNVSNVFQSVEGTNVELTYKIEKGFGDNSCDKIICAFVEDSKIKFDQFYLKSEAGENEYQQLFQDAELAVVVAENAGKWGNDLAVSFGVSSENQGKKEKTKLIFNNYGTKLEKLTGKIDLYQINEDNEEIKDTRKTFDFNIEFQKDNPYEELAYNINTSLQAVYSSAEQYATYTDSYILLTAPFSGMKFDFSGVLLSSGTILEEIQVAPKAMETGGIEINVYNSNSLSTPLEIYTGDFHYDTEGLEQIINNSDPSDYIRLRRLQGADNLISLSGVCDPTYLTGGKNATKINTADYLNALDDFADTTADIMCLIDDGYSDVQVKQKLVSIAQQIRAVALLSVPSEYCGSIEKLKDYRENKLGVNSCYGALLGPLVITTDKTTGNTIQLTTGGYYAERVASVESEYGRQYAVAGARGAISGILGVSKNYKDSEWGEIYQPSQINLIRSTGGAFSIDGIKTLQKATTAMQSLPTVLVNNMIAKKLKTALEQFKYELNTSETRARIQAMCSDYLSNLQSTGTIAKYKVTCNDSNNNSADIDAHRLNITVQWVPVGIIEYIYLTLVIEKNSVNLSE